MATDYIIQNSYLIKYIGSDQNIVVPDGITRICGGAFAQTNVESVSLPHTITEIGRRAFANCKHLKRVNLIDNIRSIGDYAFFNCVNLFKDGDSELVLPKNLEYIGRYSFAYNSFKKIKSHCVNLKSISRRCFTCCNCLIEIYLPENLLEIETGAFDENINLTCLELPDSMEHIGPYAFHNCRSLKSLHLPMGVTSLSYCAFEGCSNLIDVLFHENLNEIGYCAFKGCRALINFTAASYNQQNQFKSESDVTFKSNLTYIGNRAFEDCSNLQYISLPLNQVVVVGDWAFRNSKIDVTTFPSNIHIGKTHKSWRDLWKIESAFDDNGNLTKDAKDLINRVAEISNLTRFYKGAHLRCIPISSGLHWGYCWSTKHIVISKEDQLRSSYFCDTTTIEELEFLPNVEPFDYEVFIKSERWELEQLKYKKRIGEIEFYPTVVKCFVVPAVRLEIAEALRSLYGEIILIKE